MSRSGFWGDDFLFLTHFNRTLGDLSDDHINTGKYAANLFWALARRPSAPARSSRSWSPTRSSSPPA